MKARADGAADGIRRAVQAVLVAQVVLAAALTVTVWEPTRPEEWTPPAPGDQTRPYRPGGFPAPFRRPSVPGGQGPTLPGFDAARVTFDATPMAGGGTRILLAGSLSEGDADRLSDALDAAEGPVTLALHSPGGIVQEALAMGRILRAREIMTEIPEGGACLSACPFAFAGGTARSVAEGAWLGLHQSYFDQSTLLPAFIAVEQIQFGQGAVLRYLDEMGIDPLAMVHALETPADEVYVLTQEELTRYGFVTDTEATDDG